METREEFVRYLGEALLSGYKFSDFVQTAAGHSVNHRVREQIDMCWDDLINKTYRIVSADLAGTLDAYLAAKERTR